MKTPNNGYPFPPKWPLKMGTGLAASAAHPRRNQIWVPPPPPGGQFFPCRHRVAWVGISIVHHQRNNRNKKGLWIGGEGVGFPKKRFWIPKEGGWTCKNGGLKKKKVGKVILNRIMTSACIIHNTLGKSSMLFQAYIFEEVVCKRS